MSLKDIAGQLASNVHIKIESAPQGISYATNGFVFAWGAMTFNQIMMLIGTVFAVLTYFTSLYFQRKRDQREQRLLEHRIQAELYAAERNTDKTELRNWSAESSKTDTQKAERK